MNDENHAQPLIPENSPSASPSPVSAKEEKNLENEAPAAYKAGNAPPQNTSTPRSLSELLPCPFCGGEAVVRETHRNHFVAVCLREHSCACELRLGVERDDVVRTWNKRAAPSVGAGVGEHAAGVSEEKDETPWCQRCRKDLDKCICNPLASPQVEQVSAVQGQKGQWTGTTVWSLIHNTIPHMEDFQRIADAHNATLSQASEVVEEEKEDLGKPGGVNAK